MKYSTRNNPSTVLRASNRKSFTLIELLVVLALVAILSVVVILTLNPAELLKQARDSNRLSDLATINTALNLFSTDVTSGFMGTSTVVYVSIPSASPTCIGLGLPTLPSGYAYNCATSENLRNTDGSGWIPVNFQRISSNSPISQLPIDPINTTTTRLYYAYVPGGSWELNATIEASKNKLGGSNDLTSKDGGSAVSTYEIGNNLNLNPIETGDSSLVGYWNFEEGPNDTSTDRSGYGNHGTWYGTSTAEQHYAVGKVGNYAGSFNGGSDYVLTNSFPISSPTNSLTIAAWLYAASTNLQVFLSDSSGYSSVNDFLAVRREGGTDQVRLLFANGTAISSTGMGNVFTGYNGAWVFWVGTVDYDDCDTTSYQNSINLINSNITCAMLFPATSRAKYFGSYMGTGNYFFGSIDDIRIYNRALSAAEILALYNATK